MNLLENVILSWLDAFMYTLLACKLLAHKLTGKMVVYISILSLITGTISFHAKGGLISVLLGIIVYSFFLFLFHINVIKTLYVYIIDTIILITLQVLMVSVLNIVFNSYVNNFYHDIIVQLITLFFVQLLYFKVPVDIFMNFILSKNKIFINLLLNLFVLSFVILIYWHINIEGFIENIIIMCISVILIIVLNFVILNNGLKNKLQEEELRIFKLYTPIIEELMNELRARQHEFDNHIQAIYMVSYSNGEKNKDIVEYLDQFYDSDKLSDLIKLQNKLIGGLLYSKKKIALEHQIDFSISLKTYAVDSKMKEFEIVELLGILIDNAFEAKTNQNRVYLEIDQREGMNVIQVMNKHPYLSKEVIQEMFKKSISSKGEGRGYGLYRLKSICKKYQAQITIDNVIIDSDNYVTFKIFF